MGKSDKEILEDVLKHVRDGIGPVASFKLAVLVPKLPKTRSGKIARNTIAAMAAGKPFKVSSIIHCTYLFLASMYNPYISVNDT